VEKGSQRKTILVMTKIDEEGGESNKRKEETGEVKFLYVDR